MKEYTITGQREDLENFIESADWGGIFREFHYWKRQFVSLNGIDPYIGATTIEKHRVYNR